MEENGISKIIVDCAIEVHRENEPGGVQASDLAAVDEREDGDVV